MRLRWRIAGGVAIFLAGCVTGCLVALWPWMTRPPVGPPVGPMPQTLDGGLNPQQGDFVGFSETEIVERFGPPTHRWKGHFGLRSDSEYPDAITATYILPAGILFLSFCEEGGRLVCFTSVWQPDGWVID